MATDDISTTAVTLAKRPVSDKHRIHSHSLSGRKSRIDGFHFNRTYTASNRSLSKLPNLLSKAGIYPSTAGRLFIIKNPSDCILDFFIGSASVKRYRSEQRDPNTSLSSKLEQQSTVTNSDTRLPTLYSITNEYDQKRMSEFRRRQVCFNKMYFKHIYSFISIDLCIKSFHA